MTKRSLALTVAFAAAALFGAAPRARADATIKIGAPLALTGPEADAGDKEQSGYDMCVDAVNARGGVKVGDKPMKLELVKYDYQSDTNRAVQMMQRLVTVDQVNFLLAPYGSGDTKAAAVVAARYGITMMATSASTESIYDQGFKNLFGTLYSNHFISDAEVAYFSKYLKPGSKIAVLAMNSLFPKSIAAALKDTAQKAGFQVVFDGLFPQGASDFSSQLTQIKGLAPDWIYVTGYTQDTILVRRQMVELGVDAKVVLMTAGPSYPEFEQNLKQQADNVTTDTWWWYSAAFKDSYIYGSAVGYDQAFQAKYHKHPTYLEAAATAGCEILAEAIESAGSLEGEAVRKALRDRQFDTFYGPVRFGASGQNVSGQPFVLQIQKGELIILAPESAKQADLILGK